MQVETVGGGLLNKLGMSVSWLWTGVGWVGIETRVCPSGTVNWWPDCKKASFSWKFPKGTHPAVLDTDWCHHVIKTPSYNEPGKKVKRKKRIRCEEIYDFDFWICQSGLRAVTTYGVPWIIPRTSSLPSCPPSRLPCPEEGKSISISARLNDWVPINLRARDGSFVFKMAINCSNTDRAGKKLRVLKMLALNQHT